MNHTTPKLTYIAFLCLLILACNIASVSAKNIYTLNSQKSGSIYKNTLKVTESETGNILTNLPLPKSYNSGNLYYIEDSKFVVFYYRSKKNQAHIVLIDTKTHQITNKLNIDPLNFSFDDVKRTQHWFLSFNQDLSQFLIFVGKGKKQKLLAIDLSSGKIIKEYSMGWGDTKILRSNNRRYLWAEKINLKDKPIRIFDTAEHKELQSIPVDSTQLNTQSVDNLLFIQHKVRLKKNSSTYTYQVIVFDMAKNNVIHKFNSSYPTVVFNTESQQGIYLLGRSFGKKKKFIFHQINLLNEVKDWTQEQLDFKPLWAQLKVDGDNIHMFATGDHQVLKMNINDKSSYQLISIPDKSDNAIINDSGDLLYYTQASGSNVGLVDFSKNQFINAEKTGRSDVKFGQFIGTFLSAALTAPSGVSIYPTNGLQFSKNFLMLSNNEKWLFALNVKTDDVTIFNATDLSDKKIISTGKKTFQMIQFQNSESLPVVLLSSKMASFINPQSGQLMNQISYDAIKEISGSDLIVEKDDSVTTIPLFKPDI